MLELSLNLSVVLLGAVIAQGIFAAVILSLLKHNIQANRLLSLLLLSFSLWLFDTLFTVGHLYQQEPNLYFLPIYYSFAFGPLVYYYTKAMTDQTFQFKKTDLLHFIPVFFQGALYIFLQFQDYNFRRWFWVEVHYPYTYNLEFYLSFCSLLIYLILGYRLILIYQNRIKNHYSEISTINLSWLKRVFIYLSLVTALWLVDALIRGIWNYYQEQPFSAIAMGFVLLGLAIGGILQVNLLTKEIPNVAIEVDKVEVEQLNPHLLESIKSQMETQKYYLEPNLTLTTFAKHLELPPRLVSTHINQGLKVSFIDFVNQYRVAAVKHHIKKKDLSHLTLLGIALESGFSSKSTFNRVFKKMTGKSPSNYQKTTQNTN